MKPLPLTSQFVHLCSCRTSAWTPSSFLWMWGLKGPRKHVCTTQVRPEWSVCVSEFNLWSLNSPPLLLSGPSPTPWRSSPAPSPRCSHYLEETDAPTRQVIATYRKGFFSVLLTCRNPTSADVVTVSQCQTDLSMTRLLPEYWFKH